MAVVIALLGIYGVCRLNRYGFDLYLEIDLARETQSELAVMAAQIAALRKYRKK